MPTLKETLKDLQRDVSDTRELANQNLELDHSLFEHLQSVADQVAEAIDSSAATADLVSDLSRELASIQHEIAKAVALSGMLHYKSQNAVAKSITDAAGDYVAGQAVGGVLKVFAAGLLGLAVAGAGARIADAIESNTASDKSRDGSKSQVREAIEALIRRGESGVFEIADGLTLHLRRDTSFVLVRSQGRNALWAHYRSLSDLQFPISWNASPLNGFDAGTLP